MEVQRVKVLLWTGPKHSGKSTAAMRLAERAGADGFSVAGILAPSVYRDGKLAGFDAVNVATGRRVPLARLARHGHGDAGRFAFQPVGLRFGIAALTSAAARSAHLAIVDEFGPWELRGGGWRSAVDGLIAGSGGPVLLVVRAELQDEVTRLYTPWRLQSIAATEPDSADRVLGMLRAWALRALPPGVPDPAAPSPR